MKRLTFEQLSNIFLKFSFEKPLKKLSGSGKFFSKNMLQVSSMGILVNRDCISNYHNEQHPSIKFTDELQKDNTLSFLDVLVRKKENCFETHVYRKPTFTGLGMKCNGAISETYNYNLVHCLLEITFNICSTQTKFQFIF